MSRTWLHEFNLRIPVIQAPMAGISSGVFAALAARSGVVGSLGAGRMSGSDIRIQAEEARQLAPGCPLNVNLFVREHGRASGRDFEAQLRAVMALQPEIASFTHGVLAAGQVRQLQDRNIRVIGTCGSVSQAITWLEAGADALCAQGIESGGPQDDEVGMGLFALVPAVRALSTLPLIAAGGIVDGRGVRAALTLGADFVQMGTAFLVTDESPLSEEAKKTVLDPEGESEYCPGQARTLARMLTMQELVDTIEVELDDSF